MLDSVYIVRHASRMSEDSFRFASPTQTLRDPPLTAHGLSQTTHLARHLRDKGIAAIFCSPFWRCLQTATPVAQALDLPIYVEPGLSEFFGPVKAHTGVHPRPPPADILTLNFNRINAAGHRPLLYPPRTGETLSAFHDRATTLLTRLLEELEEKRPDAKVVLLVTHAATLIALGRALLDDASATIPTPTAGLSRYTRQGSRQPIGYWKADYLGDCSYLPRGAEGDWDISTYVQVEEAGVCPADEDGDEEYSSSSKL